MSLSIIQTKLDSNIRENVTISRTSRTSRNFIKMHKFSEWVIYVFMPVPCSWKSVWLVNDIRRYPFRYLEIGLRLATDNRRQTLPQIQNPARTLTFYKEAACTRGSPSGSHTCAWITSSLTSVPPWLRLKIQDIIGYPALLFACSR